MRWHAEVWIESDTDPGHTLINTLNTTFGTANIRTKTAAAWLIEDQRKPVPPPPRNGRVGAAEHQNTTWTRHRRGKDSK